MPAAKVCGASAVRSTVTGPALRALATKSRTSLSPCSEATTFTTTRLVAGSTRQLATPSGALRASMRFMVASSWAAECSTIRVCAPVARTAPALPASVIATVSSPVAGSSQDPP
ncbi:hypothetical protein SMICM304S_05967 [Streptomyces microflavus]